LEKSWLFVNPSFKEGWGMVNIEANHYGLPVIGSDVSGIRDSIVHGKTGLLFDYGDYGGLSDDILMLLRNGRLRMKIGKNAVRWSEKFTWKKSADRYLELLK